MVDTCKNCKHFIQHYIKVSRIYIAVDYGHCVCPKFKDKISLKNVCRSFKEKDKPIIS